MQHGTIWDLIELMLQENNLELWCGDEEPVLIDAPTGKDES